jgi:hypothetical protein
VEKRSIHWRQVFLQPASHKAVIVAAVSRGLRYEPDTAVLLGHLFQGGHGAFVGRTAKEWQGRQGQVVRQVIIKHVEQHGIVGEHHVAGQGVAVDVG